MPSNIVAYEWSLNATAHIAYETDDTHIAERLEDTYLRVTLLEPELVWRACTTLRCATIPLTCADALRGSGDADPRCSP